MSVLNLFYIFHGIITSWLIYNWYMSSRTCFKNVEEYDAKDLFSSVWCASANSSSRHCVFRNLCVASNRREFLFFYDNRSTVIGVPSDDGISDKLVDLSSVENHNAHVLRYTVVPLEHVVDFDIEYVPEIVFLFARFNPDNIMHVVHDDLLPLFVSLSLTDDNSRLFFTDGRPSGDYYDLYKLLFEENPILIQELPNNKLTCFQKAYVGVSKHTIWYQYGFHKPQGPVRQTSLFQATEIKKFCRFARWKMDITERDITGDGIALIVSRKQNRLILNEDRLAALVNEVTGFKVIFVSLENNSLPVLIKYFSQAKLVIGMHGSLLVLSMFLPPGSILIELFPYRINPLHYTAYKTLATIPGMKLVYRSWVNLNAENTVTHPNNSPEYGGIVHLPVEEQIKINSSLEVPLHLCCYHPEWLYRIYQDTVVELTSFKSVLKDAITDSCNVDRDDVLLQGILRPSIINEITCNHNGNGFNVRWKPAWNLAYLKPRDVAYEIWIQEVVTGHLKAISVSKTFLTLDLECPGKEYYVWVRCIADKRNGSIGTHPAICRC